MAQPGWRSRGNEPAGQLISSSSASVRQEPAEKGRVLKLHPDELVRLASRLKPICTGRTRPGLSWWMPRTRHDLDVSTPLWGEACLAMGREQAAIALAVVSTKDPAHFRTTPGGISTAWWRRRRPAS